MAEPPAAPSAWAPSRAISRWKSKQFSRCIDEAEDRSQETRVRKPGSGVEFRGQKQLAVLVKDIRIGSVEFAPASCPLSPTFFLHPALNEAGLRATIPRFILRSNQLITFRLS